MADPTPGTILDGHRFSGGNPADPASWVKIPDVGAVEGGYRFKGGDPADKGNWEIAGGPVDTVKQMGSDLRYGPLGPIARATDRLAGTDIMAGLENFGTGFSRGLSNLIGTPRVIADAPANLANFAARKIGGTNAPQVPTPSQMMGPAADVMLPAAGDVQSVANQVLPPRTATTAGGRLMQDLGQAVGAAPAPQLLGFNLAGGLGSWGAGELTNQNPWAKAGGGILGAGLYGLAQQTAPNAVSMLRRRLDQYSQAELDAAQALQREAQARGVPLMAQEALDKSRSEPMAQLAGHAAAQPQGRPIHQFAGARVQPGGAIPAAIDDAANAIAPRVANPNEVSRALGAAADKAVKEPQIARVTAANPLKAAAAGDTLDAALKAGTIQQIDTALAQALPGGPVAGHLEKFKALVTNAKTVGQMDEALDAFRTIYKSLAFDGSAVPDSVRTVLKPLVQGGYAGLETTNPSYQAFREVYKGTPGQPSQYSIAVEQAQASPAARIAQAQTNPALEGATGAFKNWLHGGSGGVPAPSVVKAEISRLAKQDPQAARDALRAIIQRDADAAFRITKEGIPPPDAGVGFVKNVAGTDETRKALVAAVEGVTGNSTTAKGFERLLEIIQRTGVTPGIGSPTAGRGAAMLEAGQGGAIGSALQGANLSRGSFLGALQNWNEMARAGKSWGEIAELLTQPDSVAQIRQLALLNPASSKAKTLAATILQGSQAPVTGRPR